MNTALNTTLANEIRTTGGHLLKTLDLFAPQQINVKPFEGSWTAGQVVDHILKSGGGTFEVLHGACKPTDRPYDEMDAGLKKMFLDYGIKMQSPVEILPTEMPLQKEQLQNNVQHMLSKLEQAAENLNQEETCLAFEFPGSGPLTRYEWLRFFVYHTTRHTHQLSQIFARLSL